MTVSKIPKLVYVCAPLGGHIWRNLGEVIEYTRFVFKCGAIPVVPHFFALALNDKDPEERQQGIAAGLMLLLYCEEMWIFGEEITKGMVNEMRLCEHSRIKMVHITPKEVDEVLGGKTHEKD